MRHYWILGLFGLGLYLAALYAKEGSLPLLQARERVPIQVTEQRQWSWDLGPGRVVEIKNVNGSITAEPAASQSVEVVAVKRARRSNPAEVRVEAVEHQQGITVCAVYPSRRGDNRCAPGDEGRLDGDRSDVQVNFVVRIPESIRFVGTTVNGSVTAEGLSEDVRASSVNGSIRIVTEGAASATSVNGSIVATMGRTGDLGALHFETRNGSITLTLPEDIDAEFSGGTMNGRIASDLPVTVTGRNGPRSLSGVLGSGGKTIHLSSMNGGINIRRGN